jgi:hypothetical protein
MGFVAISIKIVSSHSVAMCSNMSNKIVVPTSYIVVEPANLFSSMISTIQGFMTILITRKTINIKNTLILPLIHP